MLSHDTDMRKLLQSNASYSRDSEEWQLTCGACSCGAEEQLGRLLDSPVPRPQPCGPDVVRDDQD